MKILTSNNLSVRIMRRIYLIWILRRIKSPVFIKTVLLALVVWQSFSRISFFHIIRNSPSLLDPYASYEFFYSAFFNTELVVRVLVICFLAVILWIFRDFSKKTVFPDLLSGV